MSTLSNQPSEPAGPVAADPAARMRVKHGRVMHAVVRRPDGWLRSLCRWAPVRGMSPVPRALAPAEDWSPHRYAYPDCGHCPPDPS
jgi:hypothetical protein